MCALCSARARLRQLPGGLPAARTRCGAGARCAGGGASHARRRASRRRRAPSLPPLPPFAPRRRAGGAPAAAGAAPLLLLALLLLLATPAAAQLAWANGESTSTDSAPYVYNATVTRLGAVPDSRCCAWSRWCPGGALRFRCTPAVLAACAAGGTGPRCEACAVCEAAAATPAALALRATAPLSDASQARGVARAEMRACTHACARARTCMPRAFPHALCCCGFD
jgi:hypothetical protein